MQLQELLYGTWTPPKDAPTRIHRIGLFSNDRRYEPPPIKLKRERQSPESEEKLLKLMKKLGRPVTSVKIAEMTSWTRNHCGILLCKLWKDKKLKREKVSNGQVRVFLYSYIGEQDARSSK